MQRKRVVIVFRGSGRVEAGLKRRISWVTALDDGRVVKSS